MANTQNQSEEQAKAAAEAQAKAAVEAAEAQAKADAEAAERAKAEIEALIDARVAEALAGAPANITIEAIPGDVSDPETTSSDTTVSGGRYLVNGQLVDANGKPVKGAKAEDGE